MSDINSTEQWRPVVGYEGAYEVSTMGRVRSLARLDAAGRALGGRMLRCSIDIAGEGYRYTKLTRDGIGRKVNVHVLVLEAFVGPRPSPEHEALHGDGERHHAALSNLRWGTRIENWADKWVHQTATAGERSVSSVLTAEMVAWIRESKQSSLALAPVLGVASSTIRAVRSGQNWRHQKTP